MRTGRLLCFVSVRLPIGLTIRDCPVLTGSNGPWVNLPGKPQIDKEGQPRRDAKGKLAYLVILEWDNPRLRRRFSDAVIDLIRAHHPDVLEGGDHDSVRRVE
jgi:hypothetical protein